MLKESTLKKLRKKQDRALKRIMRFTDLESKLGLSIVVSVGRCVDPRLPIAIGFSGYRLGDLLGTEADDLKLHLTSLLSHFKAAWPRFGELMEAALQQIEDEEKHEIELAAQLAAQIQPAEPAAPVGT